MWGPASSISCKLLEPLIWWGWQVGVGVQLRVVTSALARSPCPQRPLTTGPAPLPSHTSVSRNSCLVSAPKPQPCALSVVWEASPGRVGDTPWPCGIAAGGIGKLGSLQLSQKDCPVPWLGGGQWPAVTCLFMAPH